MKRVAAVGVAFERKDGAGRLRAGVATAAPASLKAAASAPAARRFLADEQPFARRGNRAESQGRRRLCASRSRSCPRGCGFSGRGRRRWRRGNRGGRHVRHRHGRSERPRASLLGEHVHGGGAGADEEPVAILRQRGAESIADRGIRRRQRRRFLPG